MNEEIERLMLVIRRETLNTDLQNIESSNIGSKRLEKAEIVNKVCKQALEARQFLEYCLICLEYLLTGNTFDDFVNSEVEKTSGNINDGDKKHKFKMLKRLAPEMLELI